MQSRAITCNHMHSRAITCDVVKHEHMQSRAAINERQSSQEAITRGNHKRQSRGHPEAIKRPSRGNQWQSMVIRLTGLLVPARRSACAISGNQWQSGSPGCSCLPGAAPAQSALAARPHTCADAPGCRPHPKHLRARCAQTCVRVHSQWICRVKSFRRRGGQRGT